MTAATTKTQATAAQLKSILSRYDSLIGDYYSCSGVKELQYWVECAEGCIDRNVKVLALGVSKRNEAHKIEISKAYERLQALIVKAEYRIKTEGRNGMYIV